jgi:hypothetical protein
MNIGSSNRLQYDRCAYQKKLYESTSVGARNMYLGHYENASKCVNGKFWFKQSPEIVDRESELKNLTRPISDCDQFKYNPTCAKSGMCTSTFDESNPIVLAPEVCPIVHNNIERVVSTGLPPLTLNH